MRTREEAERDLKKLLREHEARGYGINRPLLLAQLKEKGDLINAELIRRVMVREKYQAEALEAREREPVEALIQNAPNESQYTLGMKEATEPLKLSYPDVDRWENLTSELTEFFRSIQMENISIEGILQDPETSQASTSTCPYRYGSISLSATRSRPPGQGWVLLLLGLGLIFGLWQMNKPKSKDD